MAKLNAAQKFAAQQRATHKLVAEFATAITLADSIIERAFGVDTPNEWRSALRKVVKARTKAHY